MLTLDRTKSCITISACKQFLLLFSGTIYEEFQYRRPPPSYNASMQEYQQQLVLAQIQSTQSQNTGSTPNSPPPTYKSHASTVRPGLHITFPVLQGDDYPSSRPPTYRSTAGTLNRPRINTNPNENESQRNDRTNNQGTEASQEQIMNERNNSHSRPETPNSPSLTLQRANQVVDYLDNVLDSSIREMEGSSSGTAQVTGNITTDTTSEVSSPSNAESNRRNTETDGLSAGSRPANVELNQRSTTTTQSSYSVMSSNSAATTTSSSTGSSESSSSSSSSSASSRDSGDSSHIVADTHLWYIPLRPILAFFFVLVQVLVFSLNIILADFWT